MADITIRTAGPQDVADIQRLYRQLDAHHVKLLPEIFQPADGDARPANVITDFLSKNDAAYLLAEVHGKAVGFLNICRSSQPKHPIFRSHDFALIENVVVEKSQRGKGIGKALFDAGIAWAREKGLRYVQTLVWSANESARTFYLDQGFLPLTEKLELDLEKNNVER